MHSLNERNRYFILLDSPDEDQQIRGERGTESRVLTFLTLSTMLIMFKLNDQMQNLNDENTSIECFLCVLKETTTLTPPCTIKWIFYVFTLNKPKGF